MTENKNSVEITDYRFLEKQNFRRVFIIGAGISADALIPTGKGLLREAILTALKENTGEINFEEMVNNVLKRLKMIYPKFDYSDINTWPTYEEYFDTIYDIIKKKRENNIRIDNFLINGFERGIDKDAMRILYWYFYIACNRWAENLSAEYLPEFISAETQFKDDAVISLNYDWLFERIFSIVDKEARNPKIIRDILKGEKLKERLKKIKHIYGSDSSDIKIFKPHGSMNWLIGPKKQIDDENKVKIFSKDNEKCIYYSAYIDYKFLYKKDFLMAIVPPQGVKGFIDPIATIAGYELKEDQLKEEYELLKDFLNIEKKGAYKAIDRAEDEIWFVGTTLEYDKYLLNMVKIKKLKDKKIKIKLITPDEEKANNLSKFLGEIYYYKGTMRQYKEDLTKLNSNKEEWDKGLDDDKFIKKGG
jgi:hypothetical protein